MIELNLLPPQEKELLRLEQTGRKITLYSAGILFSFLSFAILLGLIWFFISIQLKSYSQNLQNIEGSFQGQGVDRQKQLIAEFNQYLEKLDQIQKNHRYFSPAIVELASIIPSGARIESLSIDANGQVTLAGFAAQRSQVLTLQDSLEKSDFFTEIEKPLSNLVRQTNIDFNFKFTLQTEKLTNDKNNQQN